MSNCIKVLVIGKVSEWKLSTIKTNGPDYESHGFVFKTIENDEDLFIELAAFEPHVILTLSNPGRFFNLNAAPLEVRGRWISVHKSHSGEMIANQIMTAFMNVCDGRKRFSGQPLVSVFTATYRTGFERLKRAFESLKRQTRTDWEWVIFDDSDDSGETFEIIRKFSELDFRVRVFRGSKNSGVVGQVKYQAARLCKGQILVELDHDDALTPRCLLNVAAAFEAFPDAGFAYSNCCEISESYQVLKYGDGWAFGYGSYRDEWFDGFCYGVAVSADINCRTIRHITSAPNHVRAWRKDVYDKIGGHCCELHVCDDYELIVRTFLATKMIHIDHFGYIQYFDGNNTQSTRNPEIQRITRFVSGHHDAAIHARLRELNIPDSIWTPSGLNWDGPKEPGIANYTFKAI